MKDDCCGRMSPHFLEVFHQLAATSQCSQTVEQKRFEAATLNERSQRLEYLEAALLTFGIVNYPLTKQE